MAGERNGARSRVRAVRNAGATPIASVPRLADAAELVQLVVDACARGARLVCLLPLAGAGAGEPDLCVVLAADAQNEIWLVRAPVLERRYPSLTATLPQAQAIERALWERDGLVPEGHPWLKPLRLHADLEREPSEAARRVGEHPFFRVEGHGVHEVAVGPVHAGIIEPGHFRFQCHGENVLSLEIQLGFQHRDAQSLLATAKPSRRLAVVESIAGDTAVGHALAYCGALEALAAVELPLPAHSIRAVAFELERLANHVGDLGGLCNDVGYLPGASWFGRLRGEFLNALVEISGNRFGRGLVRPGGVRFGIDSYRRRDLAARLERARKALEATAEVTFETPTLASRFETTGQVSLEMAEELGLVGPVARASGCDRDVRRDHPSGLYRFVYVPTALADTGDVMGRALVRLLEAERSIELVLEQLDELGDARPGDVGASLPPCAPDSIAVSMVEGWRGEIVHVLVTDASGAVTRHDVVDPSVHNWFGLAIALRGNQISDFPLCNKSFNLSYSGHDL